jgi:hypothetical protein
VALAHPNWQLMWSNRPLISYKASFLLMRKRMLIPTVCAGHPNTVILSVNGNYGF